MGYGAGSKKPKRLRCLHFGRDLKKEDDEESKEEEEEEDDDDEIEAADELMKKFNNFLQNN